MTDLPQLEGPALTPLGDIKPEKLVIMCHGIGANGQDLIGLAVNWHQDLPNVAFFSPDAPQPYPGMPGGYQWWDLRGFTPAEQEEGLRYAAPILNQFIDEKLAETGLTEADTALVGFSQGTMLSLFVGLQRERQLAGIVGYSGALAGADLLAPNIKSRPPVLMIHGDMDQMIPPMMMQAAARFLAEHDVRVQTHISQGMGHGVAADGINFGRDFLNQVFAV